MYKNLFEAVLAKLYQWHSGRYAYHENKMWKCIENGNGFWCDYHLRWLTKHGDKAERIDKLLYNDT